MIKQVRKHDIARVRLETGEIVGEIVAIEEPTPGHQRVTIRPFDDREPVNTGVDRVEVAR